MKSLDVTGIPSGGVGKASIEHSIASLAKLNLPSRTRSKEMTTNIESLIKDILPASTWSFVFSKFPVNLVRFSNPPYEAVRVSSEFMLVRVPLKEATNGNEAKETPEAA